MASFAIKAANEMASPTADGQWRENYWGLYVVGSRARGEQNPNSDLDLLSVGTFRERLGSIGQDSSDGVLEGFDLQAPENLPSRYNIGEVNRKYLIRATPTE